MNELKSSQIVGARKRQLRQLRNKQTIIREGTCIDNKAQGRVETVQQAPAHLKPVHLGKIAVKTPVVLSPMAGVTNWPFRVLCESYGPDGLYVAEMVTARALIARNPKALRLVQFAPSEKIRSLQLYGVNPDAIGIAARMLVDNGWVDHIDLNFDALLYYDLLSHHNGYANLQDYRYLNTGSLTIGISYKLIKKEQQ